MKRGAAKNGNERVDYTQLLSGAAYRSELARSAQAAKGNYTAAKPSKELWSLQKVRSMSATPPRPRHILYPNDFD